MFFPKNVKGATEKRHRVSLNLDFNKSKGDFLKQRNVERAGNSLVSSFGYTSMNYTFSITKAVLKRQGFLLVMVDGRGLCCFSESDIYRTLSSVPKDCVVSHVEHQNKDIFSCTSGTYYTANGYMATKMCTDYYPSMAVCYNRIFGVNGKDLYMTEAGDAMNWENVLKITSSTVLNAVVALDKLYVLGDTCYTLSPDAEELNMKFAPFCYGIGTVQPESVASIGKRAIFASNNGLFQLTSSAIKPIFTQLNDFVSFDGCVACVHQGRYYVTCKRKDKDMTCNDILLVLDVDSEQIDAVLDVQAQHISSIGGVLYISIGMKLHKKTDVNVESSYCQTVDFGCSDVKYLNKLSIRSRSDVDVWIKGDGEKRRYRIKGKNTLQHLPVAGFGRQFDVEVQALNGMKLDSIELTARSYEV